MSLPERLRRIYDATPAAEDVLALPRWAIVAFLARVARRWQPMYNRDGERFLGRKEVVDAAIGEAELAAAEGKKRSPVPHSSELRRIIDDAMGIGNSMETCGYDPSEVASAYHAALMAMIARTCATFDPDDFADDYTNRQLKSVFPNTYQTIAVAERVCRDLELLRQHAAEHSWNADTPVTPEFFSSHSEFSVAPIVEVASLFDAKLAEYFIGHPNQLRQLSPRVFEELVAEIWKGFGFDVELTQATRDGGRDVIAVADGQSKAKYLIECKRYSPQRKVGVAVVHRLNGVVQLEGANKGIIATTSTFTHPAEQAINSTWYLEGRDFNGIIDWLHSYQELQMYSDLGLRLQHV